MYGRPAHRGAFQLHRLKDGNGIDQTGTAGAPLHFEKRRLTQLIRPLKGDGIPGKFRRPAQGRTVLHVLIGEHKPVGRHVVGLYLLLEITNVI